MSYKITTNGGHTMLTTGDLERVQAFILAHRAMPLYVRSGVPTHHGWVFEVNGPVIIFSVYGKIHDDQTTAEYCPWMLTLRRALYRAPISPSVTITEGEQQ